MFAVIKSGGKQFRVAADDILKLERLPGDEGERIEIGNVLMVGNGKDVTIGAPFVDGAMVTAEVVEQGRNRKLVAFKKRRRQNSRRTIGHRQQFTKVQILEILTGGAKPSKKAAGKKAPATKADAAPAKETKQADAPKAKAEAAKAKAPAKQEKKTAAATGDAPLFKAPKGDPDKLTDIKGIGPVAEKQLNEQGIMTFAQIAKLTDAEVAKIDEAMPFSADQISDWRDQAKKLAK